MTVERVQQIKNKIEKLKNKKAKSEGIIEKILQNLKEEFDIEDIKNVQDHINDLEEEIATNENKIDELTKKIEKLTDWSLI